MKPIKVAYPSIDVGYLPAFVAQAKGIFKKQGLEVVLVETQGARKGVEELLKGKVQFIMTIGPALRAIQQGALKVLVGMTGMPAFSLIVRRGINTVEELRGKKIGVSSGGMTFALIHELFRRNGLQSGDVSYVNIPGSTPKLKALRNGSIAAALLPSPRDFEAIKGGLRPLVFLENVMSDLRFTGLIAKADYNENKRPIVQRMVDAIVEAVKVTRNDPGAAIRVMQDRFKISADVASASYRLVQESLSPDFTQAHFENMAEILSNLPELKVQRKSGKR